ncbi:MAG: GNAT family N-acetyltransferase [Clostridia bacterium]|nr:GNAT family N-acetyltransferase [Clostridia bacterium]
MIIRTRRLVLRPFKTEDVTWYYDIIKNTDMVSRLKSLNAKDEDEAASHIAIFENGDFKNDFYCVITDKRKNVLGFIIAVRLTRMTMDVSYFLKEEYRHNGYMQEALAAVTEAIRDDNPLARIRLEIEKDNIPSLNIAKRMSAIMQDKGDKFMCYI